MTQQTGYGQGVDIEVGVTEVPDVRLPIFKLQAGGRERRLLNIISKKALAFETIYVKGLGYLHYNNQWEAFTNMGRPSLGIYLPVMLYNWNAARATLIDESVEFAVIKLTRQVYDKTVAEWVRLNPGADIRTVDWMATNDNPQYPMIDDLRPVGTPGAPKWFSFSEAKGIQDLCKLFRARFRREIATDAGRKFESEAELLGAVRDAGPGFGGNASTTLPAAPNTQLGGAVSKGMLPDDEGDDLPFDEGGPSQSNQQVIPPTTTQQTRENAAKDLDDEDVEDAVPVGPATKQPEIEPEEEDEDEGDLDPNASGDDDDEDEVGPQATAPAPQPRAPKKSAPKKGGGRRASASSKKKDPPTNV